MGETCPNALAAVVRHGLKHVTHDHRPPPPDRHLNFMCVGDEQRSRAFSGHPRSNSMSLRRTRPMAPPSRLAPLSDTQSIASWQYIDPSNEEPSTSWQPCLSAIDSSLTTAIVRKSSHRTQVAQKLNDFVMRQRMEQQSTRRVCFGSRGSSRVHSQQEFYSPPPLPGRLGGNSHPQPSGQWRGSESIDAVALLRKMQATVPAPLLQPHAFDSVAQLQWQSKQPKQPLLPPKSPYGRHVTPITEPYNSELPKWGNRVTSGFRDVPFVRTY